MREVDPATGEITYHSSEYGQRWRKPPPRRRGPWWSRDGWIEALSWPGRILAGVVIVALAFVAGIAAGEALEWLLYAPAPGSSPLGD